MSVKKDRGTGLTAIKIITAGEPYGSGDSDESLRAKAEAEAQARMYTPAWGDNRRPHPMHEVVYSADTARSLQGHELDGERVDLEQHLDRLLPAIARLEAGVIRRIEVLERALLSRLNLERKLEEEGLPLPESQPGRRWLALGVAVLIGFGELFLLSPAFQVFGLSDHPLFWFVNAQNLGALSGVVSLLVLAHALADNGKGRPGDDQAANSGGKWYERLAACSAGYRIHILGVAAMLVGLAAVRGLYFTATHKGNAWAAVVFLFLNLGMVIAARWVVQPDPRPYAERWHRVLTRVDEADEDLVEPSETYESRVGDYNATVSRRDALISQYGHALAATGSDAQRQIELLAGHTRLSQPEIVSDRMFADTLPKPTDSQLQKDVRDYCTNEGSASTPFRRYERLDTKAVRDRYTQMEQRLATARQAAQRAAGTSSPMSRAPVTAAMNGAGPRPA